MRRPRRPKRLVYVSVAALLATSAVACSAETKEEPTKTSAAASSAKELKALLLTSAQVPSGFEVFRSTVTEPSAPPADASEKVRPAECAVLRNPDVKATAETVTAAARILRPSAESDMYTMTLAGWAEPDAKARMAALRSALETCGAIRYKNIHSNGTRTARFKAEKTPALGDEALRYALHTPTVYQGITVVRVQGVITILKADLPLDHQSLKPAEALVRAQVAKAQRALR